MRNSAVEFRMSFFMSSVYHFKSTFYTVQRYNSIQCTYWKNHHERRTKPVHPHACGEHDRTALPTKPVRRFIPTHVGNTRAQVKKIHSRAVHPHACGEHLHQHLQNLLLHGSSPRMWGTRSGAVTTNSGTRFIPTHVGNTHSIFASRHIITVHPHACGEHFLIVFCSLILYGSSPRMWGTRFPLWILHFCHRFIPTHVGNTKSPIVKVIEIPVHPHACGEHVWFVCGVEFYSGSSPRMWGTPHNQHREWQTNRFIPTHVGNTGIPVTKETAAAVHPHACGEHSLSNLVDLLPRGSSPRMWGTRHTRTF